MSNKAKKPKPGPVSELHVECEKMARRLMQACEKGETPPAEEISLFKAVSNYLAISYKIKPPNPDEEGSFGGYAQSIAGFGARERGRGRSRAAPIGTDAAEDDED